MICSDNKYIPAMYVPLGHLVGVPDPKFKTQKKSKKENGMNKTFKSFTIIVKITFCKI